MKQEIFFHNHLTISVLTWIWEPSPSNYSTTFNSIHGPSLISSIIILSSSPANVRCPCLHGWDGFCTRPLQANSIQSPISMQNQFNQFKLFSSLPASISYSINFKTTTCQNPIITILSLHMTKPLQSASSYHICNAFNVKRTVEFITGRCTFLSKHHTYAWPSFVPFSPILPYHYYFLFYFTLGTLKPILKTAGMVTCPDDTQNSLAEERSWNVEEL